MDIKDLHDLMKELREENAQAHKDICAELKQLNGTVKWNKFSIRAIWAVFGGAWAVFLLWLKNHI